MTLLEVITEAVSPYIYTDDPPPAQTVAEAIIDALLDAGVRVEWDDHIGCICGGSGNLRVEGAFDDASPDLMLPGSVMCPFGKTRSLDEQ